MEAALILGILIQTMNIAGDRPPRYDGKEFLLALVP